jgi:lipoprotein-anchoring transpeptidase ErfK/SrfK
MKRLTSSSIIAALAVIVAGIAAPREAHAQFWGFGGANSSSDNYTVRFSKKYAPGQIIVSFGDRRLYHIIARGKAVSYPIAVPRPQSRWSGTLRISQKRVNPTWTPTPEMRRENPNLPSFVPGGHPRNPLGYRALYLGSSLYRIHGTDAPWTIGKNVSKGCIRMHNNHVAQLYRRVRVGTKVVSTWKRFKSQAISSGGGNAPSSSKASFMESVLGDNT